MPRVKVASLKNNMRTQIPNLYSSKAIRAIYSVQKLSNAILYGPKLTGCGRCCRMQFCRPDVKPPLLGLRKGQQTTGGHTLVICGSADANKDILFYVNHSICRSTIWSQADSNAARWNEQP